MAVSPYANPEDYRAYQKRYRQRPEFKIQEAVYGARWRATEAGKESSRKRTRAYTKRNRNDPKFKAACRRNQLKIHFNMTPEDYEAMLLAQDNLCAICGEVLPYAERNGLRPPVDHDHETDSIRGIVHAKCNIGIGMFDENPERLRKAAAFLEKHHVAK